MPRRLLLLLVCAAVLLAACEFQHIVPPGDAPLRYRDEVFTTVDTTSDIAYGEAVNEDGEDETLLLDLYEPAGDSVDARPAIVWIHGGGFRSGNKSSPEIVDEATTLARKGYVSVSISYRLSSVGCSSSSPTVDCLIAIQNAQHDAQAAVRWLRANAATYEIDADRIAAAGSSAGAITALNVGFDPDDPGTSGNPGYPSDVGAAVSLSGARVLTRVDEGEAWALLFHGTSDGVVPFAWAEDTLEEAHAAGVVANLTAWPGEGHVPYVDHRDEIIDQTTNFLWWALNMGGAAT